MLTPIQEQLWESATALSAGGGLALLYELMRPLCTLPHRAFRILFQMLYLMAAFAWIFLAGQLGGRGAPPLYLLMCAVGWLLTHAIAASVKRLTHYHVISKKSSKSV